MLILSFFDGFDYFRIFVSTYVQKWSKGWLLYGCSLKLCIVVAYENYN
jgi:hypothetical protein